MSAKRTARDISAHARRVAEPFCEKTGANPDHYVIGWLEGALQARMDEVEKLRAALKERGICPDCACHECTCMLDEANDAEADAEAMEERAA